MAKRWPDSPDPRTLEGMDPIQLPTNNLPQHNVEAPVRHYRGQDEQAHDSVHEWSTPEKELALEANFKPIAQATIRCSI